MNRFLCCSVIVIVLLLSACGKGAVSYGTVTDHNISVSSSDDTVNKSITPEAYFAVQSLSDNMKQMLHWVNRPVSELFEKYGTYYTISASDPNERREFSYLTYDNRLHFNSDNPPFDFDVNVVGDILSKTDTIMQVGISQQGFEIAPGMAIGKTVSQLKKDIGIDFCGQGDSFGYAYKMKQHPEFYIEFEFLDGILRYAYVSTTSLLLWQEGNENEIISLPYATQDTLRKCFEYYQNRGYDLFPLDSYEYKGIELIDTIQWDHLIATAGDEVSLWVEKTYPYRVLWGYLYPETELLWMDGQYVHPMADFVGKYTSDAFPNYQMEILSISPYGDILFNLTIDDTTLKHCNGYLQEVEHGNFMELFGAAYVCNFEYFDGHTLAGSFQYESKIWSYNASLGLGTGVSLFIPSGTGQVVRFSKHDASIENNGILRHFGCDDLAKDCFTEGNNSDKNSSKPILNVYLNKLHNTNNREFAEIECQYVGQYYFDKWGYTFSVWQERDGGYNYYVDYQNGIIIHEDAYCREEAGLKKLVLVNGNIPVAGSEFLGLWTGDGYTVEIVSVNTDEAQIRIMSPSKQIPDFEGEAEIIAQGDRLQVYYTFEEGDRIFGGYLHLDYHTWGLDLHVSDSNIAGIAPDIYALRRVNNELTLSQGEGNSVSTEPIEIVIPTTLDGPEVMPTGPTTTVENEEVTVIRTEYIKDAYGYKLGRIEYLSNGDKIAKDMWGQITGKYIASRDVTTDFYGKIISHGDTVVSTITRK